MTLFPMNLCVHLDYCALYITDDKSLFVVHYMPLLYVLEQSPCNWRTTMHLKLLKKNYSPHIKYDTVHGKLSELHFDVLLFSNSKKNVLKSRELGERFFQ